MSRSRRRRAIALAACGIFAWIAGWMLFVKSDLDEPVKKHAPVVNAMERTAGPVPAPAALRPRSIVEKVTGDNADDSEEAPLEISRELQKYLDSKHLLVPPPPRSGAR
jgi:hypothetical protein